MKQIIIAVLLTAAFFTAEAHAKVRAASCDGCTASQKAARATTYSPGDVVYVFDQEAASVLKYRVVSDTMDAPPWYSFTYAQSLAVERSMTDAWEDHVVSQAVVVENGAYVLPGDFPVQSVAGAMLDPAASSTAIEDFLMSQDILRQMERDVSTLIFYLLKDSIPLIDLGNLLKSVTISIKFPDGSTMDYELAYSVNAFTGVGHLELSSAGNARLANGKAAPTTYWGFRNVNIWGNYRSIGEWALWASSMGIPISGSGKSTRMSCSISGSKIVCSVVYRR